MKGCLDQCKAIETLSVLSAAPYSLSKIEKKLKISKKATPNLKMMIVCRPTKKKNQIKISMHFTGKK